MESIPSQSHIESAQLAGIEVFAIQPIRALEWVEGNLASSTTVVLNHLPADPFVLARKNEPFRAALQKADLNVPDGMAVVWALRLMGHPEVRQRVYGPDFMRLICEQGQARGIRHYFYGGTQSVLDRLVKNLTNNYPRINIVAAEAPPFRDLSQSEKEALIKRVSDLKPHIFWVGLGTPKQQFFAAEFKERLDTRLIITVGAAFDFLAGAKPEAPQWMKKNGLEWLFRFGSEPRRLWKRYLLGNPRFVLGFFGDYIRYKKSSRPEK